MFGVVQHIGNHGEKRVKERRMEGTEMERKRRKRGRERRKWEDVGKCMDGEE